ncbi:beta-galactosidase-1-like protein 3 [Onthophagus taurus]|uniref:beta-galactosidase-1-like protein 3 n=1 Tax=Onthophagus taurus TaxID=166361 RepID=UPI0039BE0BDA
MLPSLYEFYTSGGINSGLSENLDSFTLNNKSLTIVSGSMHYFRVPTEYWRDRLRKMRSAGLNTVETYIPWNLHEPYEGIYDFGNGHSDMSMFLDIDKFFKLAQEEDLFAIARIGPYICAEVDFGGMPSWLLRHSSVNIRTYDKTFLYYVKRYFNALMSILTILQFSNGGSIIGFQVENEYLQFSDIDYNYIKSLVDYLLGFGVKEIIFLADFPISGNINHIHSKVLNVGNFGENIKFNLNLLKIYLNGRPCFLMEFWTGWYDVWLRNKRKVNSSKQFENDIELILKSRCSINFYMFVGGTTYGFLNGGTGINEDGDELLPSGNSYDFDAPISEGGDYTWKYFLIKYITDKFFSNQFRKPLSPNLKPTFAFKAIPIQFELKFLDLLSTQDRFHYENLIQMEYLPINNNSGQLYGYIVYRKTNLSIPENSVLRIKGAVKDFAMILINGELITKTLISKVDIYSFGFSEAINSHLNIQKSYSNAILDIIAVNLGRANYGNFKTFKNQNKGLKENSITLNDIPLKNWEIISLEFKKQWVNNLSNWTKPKFLKGPTLYKATLNLKEPFDTFVDMSSWHMGIVIVNGFVLSRYLRLGSSQTMYLPGSFLRRGDNEIIIFEHFTPYKYVCFLGGKKKKRQEPLDVPVFVENNSNFIRELGHHSQHLPLPPESLELS